MAGMYAVYHGPEKLRAIAQHIHQMTVRLEKSLNELGFIQFNTHFFDTLFIEVKRNIIEPIALRKQINFNYVDEDHISLSLNETTDEDSLHKIVALFEEIAGKTISLSDSTTESRLPSDLIRACDYLTHPVFNSHHSETALMRYIKRLERKDLALNHSMISLGSCTMKLNAAVEMLHLVGPNGMDFIPLYLSIKLGDIKKFLNHLNNNSMKLLVLLLPPYNPIREHKVNILA